MTTLRPFATPFPTKPLKYLAPLRGEKVESVPEGETYLGMEQIASWTGRRSDVELEQMPEGSANAYAAGDVLFGKLRPYLAKAYVAEERGYCSTELLVLTPLTSDPRFLRYCLLSQENIRSVDGSTYGAKMPRADWGFIGAVHFPAPARAQQERIANFLDAYTTRIDALLAEKERLQATLQDAVWDEVTRAVTLGTVGAARRATGLDWCPEVPRHWDVLLLKRLFLRTEYGISESMNPDGKVAVLRMGNVANGRVIMDDLKYVDDVPESLLLKPGELLYNRTNSLAQVGKVGLVRDMPDTPVTFASYLVRLVPNRRVSAEYLAYLLNCPDVLAIARSLALPAIGQANLNPTRYGYIHVPCPPISEQQAIVKYLDRRTSEISALAEHVVKHIERLREYRSSLISAAVSGQIDISTSKTYNRELMAALEAAI